MIQLDFGCGKNLKKDFIGIDIKKFDDVTYCCPAWKADQYFETASVDEIYSRHLLQYLTFPQVFQTLKVWYSLLKPGAVCQIIVPDFRYHCEHYIHLSDATTSELPAQDLEETLSGLWGSQTYVDEFLDVHQSGFDFKLLCAMLLKNNFKTIFRLNDPLKPFELNIMAQKPS